MPPELTASQREELEAIHETTEELGRPTELSRHLWHDNDTGYLVRHRLITWKRIPGRGNFMRSVALTPAGRAALDRAP